MATGAVLLCRVKVYFPGAVRPFPEPAPVMPAESREPLRVMRSPGERRTMWKLLENCWNFTVPEAVKGPFGPDQVPARRPFASVVTSRGPDTSPVSVSSVSGKEPSRQTGARGTSNS